MGLPEKSRAVSAASALMSGSVLKLMPCKGLEGRDNTGGNPRRAAFSQNSAQRRNSAQRSHLARHVDARDAMPAGALDVAVVAQPLAAAHHAALRVAGLAQRAPHLHVTHAHPHGYHTF